jgi:hypothetical protein
MGLIVLVLAAGFLLGTFSTLAVVTLSTDGRLDAEHNQARDKLNAVEQERDEALRRIALYEQEKLKRGMPEQDEMEETQSSDPEGSVPASQPPS